MSLVTNLSVLVPLRTEDFAFYKARLALRSSLDLAGVETIVIDDGSPAGVAAEIEAFCADRGYAYLRLHTADQVFSLARSRNAGLRAARSEFVYMDDADLVYRHNFFQEIVAELRLLAHTPFNFFSLPAVYLTAAASTRVFADTCLDASYLQVMHALLLEDPKGAPTNVLVESYAPASGVVALSRELALHLGGMTSRFRAGVVRTANLFFGCCVPTKKLAFPPVSMRLNRGT
jgi:glycosyltransferase involved in cell wall biosynthesis